MRLARGGDGSIAEECRFATCRNEAGLAHSVLISAAVLRTGTADPFSVEPGELVVVEDGVRFRDAFEREKPNSSSELKISRS
jgi:hypothetical protein